MPGDNNDKSISCEGPNVISEPGRNPTIGGDQPILQHSIDFLSCHRCGSDPYKLDWVALGSPFVKVLLSVLFTEWKVFFLALGDSSDPQSWEAFCLPSSRVRGRDCCHSIQLAFTLLSRSPHCYSQWFVVLCASDRLFDPHQCYYGPCGFISAPRIPAAEFSVVTVKGKDRLARPCWMDENDTEPILKGCSEIVTTNNSATHRIHVVLMGAGRLLRLLFIFVSIRCKELTKYYHFDCGL